MVKVGEGSMAEMNNFYSMNISTMNILYKTNTDLAQYYGYIAGNYYIVIQLYSSVNELISRLSKKDEIDIIKEYVNSDIKRLESPFFIRIRIIPSMSTPTKTETTITDYEGYVMSDLPEEEPWNIKAIDDLNLEVNIPLKKPPLPDPIDHWRNSGFSPGKSGYPDSTTVLDLTMFISDRRQDRFEGITSYSQTERLWRTIKSQCRE